MALFASSEFKKDSSAFRVKTLIRTELHHQSSPSLAPLRPSVLHIHKCNLAKMNQVSYRCLFNYRTPFKGKVQALPRYRYIKRGERMMLSTEANPPEILLHHHSDTIAKLIFNRTNKANAIGKQMLSELRENVALLSGEKGKNIRCVILTSASDRVFSAGADLKERSAMTKEEASLFVTALRSCMDELASLPMPLIASVEGAALGGGLEIALTADLIVAGSDARFGAPETGLAIIPGAGGTQRLPRLIGPARAKELIYTARKIDAKTAYEYGIAQYLVDGGCADEKALVLAGEIAENGPVALRAAKRSINSGIQCSVLEDAMEIEKENYQLVLETKDRLEGLAAFREKRKPNYKGH